jgi:hypothetical protein
VREFVKPAQIEPRDHHRLHSSGSVQDRLAEADRRPPGDAPHLILADGERPGSEDLSEVRAVRYVHGPGQRDRTADDGPGRVGDQKIRIARIANAQVREQGIACLGSPLAHLAHTGEGS